MKQLLLILAMFSIVGAVNVNQVSSTTTSTYTNFNQRVVEVGATSYAPFYNNSVLAVSGKLTIPATFKGTLIGNSYFKGVNGSAQDTVYFAGNWNFPDNFIFDTSITVLFAPGAVSEVRPEWWGCKGDSVTDNSEPLRKCIASVKASGHGGTIRFSKGKYRIVTTVNLKDIRGVRFVGDMGTVNSNPAMSDGKNDSKIFWDGDVSDSLSPVFYFSRGEHVTFEHLAIMGRPGSDATKRAYACVWMDGSHKNYRFYDCRIASAKIGIRICSGYNHATGAWTPGLSAYDATDSSTAAASVGGFASDNFYVENCEFSGTSIAGVSIESAQSLDDVMMKCQFLQTTVGVKIPSCQGLEMIAPTFLIQDTADIMLIGSSSIGNIRVNNAHTEGGGGKLCKITSEVPLGKGIGFNACGGGIIELKGSTGTISIKNCILQGISVLSDSISVILENNTIVDYVRGSIGNGKFVKMTNNKIYNIDSLTGPFDYNSSQYESNEISNWDNFSKVPMRLAGNGQLPSLILGSMSTDTTNKGMGNGINFHSIAGILLQTSNGAYLNEAGSWIATATKGWRFDQFYNGLNFLNFTGASLGGTPSFTTRFSVDSLGKIKTFDTTSSTSPTTGALVVNGGGGFAKNIVFQGRFGDIGTHDDTSVTNIATGTTYTKITGLDMIGVASAGITIDTANDRIVISDTGYYRVSFNLSGFPSAANIVWKAALFLSNSEANLIHTQSKILNANDIRSIGGASGIIHVATSGQYVDLRMRHDNASNQNFNMTYGSICINYVGNK